MPNMDKIVLVLGVCPFLLKVVNKERDICRYQQGLDRRQVNTDDFSGGVLFSDCSRKMWSATS